MADNRTEKGTPQRRTKAREKGQILRSRELVSALTFIAALMTLAFHPEMWVERWRSYFVRALDSAAAADWSSQVPVINWSMLAIAQWVAPLFAVCFFVAITSTLAQGGLVIATQALTPDLGRLNPARNLKQMFSLAALSRVLKTLVPSAAILYLAFRVISNQASLVTHSSRLPTRSALSLMGTMCFSVAWQSGLVLLAWAGVDFALQRQTYEKSLRMTKQEVRQESKDSEGNPLIKNRIRRMRREMRRRMLHRDVQKATAVITNPTHYAIALEYRPATMAAPVVVAKGRNLIAEKIKQLARWNEIPIVENPPLAQALFKAAEAGQMIPPQLYAAVAEILAFLYRAQMRMQQQQSNRNSWAPR